MGQLPIWQQQLFTSIVGEVATEHTLQQENVQKMLNDKNEKFDLIIFEMFSTEMLYGLAHHFNCPIVILSTIGKKYDLQYNLQHFT